LTHVFLPSVVLFSNEVFSLIVKGRAIFFSHEALFRAIQRQQGKVVRIFKRPTR
jgi:hypothetical protein